MGYGNFRTGVIDGTKPTPGKVHGSVNGGKQRIFKEAFDLSKANVDKVADTTNICFKKPKGHIVDLIRVVSSVSLTTSQLAFGISGTPAKYGAAKAYGTTANAPIDWHVATAEDDISDDEETIIMTASVADLPASGIVVVTMKTSAVA